MAFFRLPGLHRSWSVVWPVLLITCLLGSQFVATNHEFAVRHATCPQHGELIDVDRADAPANAVAVSVQPSKQLSTDKATDSPTHHQHCLYVSSRGNHKGFKVAGPAVESMAAVTQPVHSAFDEAPRSSAVIYLTAPKHSPPLA